MTELERGAVREWIDAWLLLRCSQLRIRAQRLPDGAIDLVAVPQKYAELFDSMASAMVVLALGGDLPRYTSINVIRVENEPK